MAKSKLFEMIANGTSDVTDKCSKSLSMDDIEQRFSVFDKFAVENGADKTDAVKKYATKSELAQLAVNMEAENDELSHQNEVLEARIEVLEDRNKSLSDLNNSLSQSVETPNSSWFKSYLTNMYDTISSVLNADNSHDAAETSLIDVQNSLKTVLDSSMFDKESDKSEEITTGVVDSVDKLVKDTGRRLPSVVDSIADSVTDVVDGLDIDERTGRRLPSAYGEAIKSKSNEADIDYGD